MTRRDILFSFRLISTPILNLCAVPFNVYIIIIITDIIIIIEVFKGHEYKAKIAKRSKTSGGKSAVGR